MSFSKHYNQNIGRSGLRAEVASNYMLCPFYTKQYREDEKRKREKEARYFEEMNGPVITYNLNDIR